MSGPRLERILASTALALILAAPIGASAFAQDAGASSATAATPSQAAAAAGAAAARQTAAEPAPSATAATASQAAAAAGAAAVATREASAAPGTAPAATSETTTAPKDAAVSTPATNPAVVSEQAAAPDPLAALDPADRAVAEKIRDLLAAKSDPIFASKRERAAAEAANAATALDEFSPPHEGYKKLKAMLAQMRAKPPGAKEIADGQLLKLNAKAPMEDARVPLLRDKLGLTGDASDLRYDAKLAEAVKKFQRANELPVTGNLDSKTIKELNGPPRDKQIDAVISNMERWRWYPRDLGKAYVIVNLPDFTLRVVHNDAQVWSTRIVIGKPDMPTPLLSETMKYITINPTWNVPPSIVYNEYMPVLQRDPMALERMGLKLVYNRDGSVHIYQPPGEANALGRIRFNFPNRFLVYQHDTPDKHLFAHDMRAYSHGCMRVQDPAKYAEVLFNIARPSENWTAEKIKRMFGTGEQDIQLPAQIWVLLTYQNAFVDDAGKLQIRRDIYNLDNRTLAAIKTERGMIEPPQERKREEAVATSQPRPGVPPRNVSFFEALFGFGRPMQARPVPPRGITR